jgi:hypothetical protein
VTATCPASAGSPFAADGMRSLASAICRRKEQSGSELKSFHPSTLSQQGLARARTRERSWPSLGQNWNRGFSSGQCPCTSIFADRCVVGARNKTPRGQTEVL